MGGAHVGGSFRAAVDRLDLSEIFFSNEEYYSKLEELKRAHERTMAELESMYQQKLQLRSGEAFDMKALDIGHRLQWTNMSPATSRHCLRKSHSAGELRRDSVLSDSSEEDDAPNDVEKGLLFSPKEHIKNMWRDFKVSSYNHQLSSSLQSLQGGQKKAQQRRQGKKSGRRDKHRVTVPKPFHMTLREAQRRKLGIKTRSEIELENMELRRQLEEVTECQRKFRASPVPAHVHLPLYEELRERSEERRRTLQEREEKHLGTVQKPFSFIERERLKKEQKQQGQPSDQEKVKPFKAKPVPKSVYAAASGEQLKEEQLYRSIKIQMRAQEMLQSSSMPPSMLTRRLSDRKKNKDGSAAEGAGSFSHRPQINKEVPDFDAKHRRFQKHLEKRKEVKPTTTCEPFELRTSQISSHKERILAELEKEQSSPRMRRWPCVSPGAVRTPNSSLCSSLSGSLELLPAKITDATKKRHEAVRKALEQRKKAEEEEERWKEKQRQREKKLQREVLKRAQANDPHLALSQTNQSKLKEFRKQDIQRKKEYKQEVKEMQQRVRGRPLLLEQVAQRNAKQAAEKRYIDALHGCDLTEEFIKGKAPESASLRKASLSSDNRQSEVEEAETDFERVQFRRVFVDDEDTDNPGGREEEEENGKASSSLQSSGDASDPNTDDDNQSNEQHYSDESYHYSDDHESYSEDSQPDDSKQQETEP
ncbi:protein FAM161A isoform X2 [Oryzias latipes]|nr:protein FAM161A isoform X2 [Oryzias latipes]